MSRTLYAPLGPFFFSSPRSRRLSTPSFPPRRRAVSVVACRATASSTGSLELETLRIHSEEEELVADGISEAAGSSVVGDEGDSDVDEKRDISGIHVPRQKYIHVSKEDLLDGVVSMFSSEKEAEEFRRFAKCLDLILHAEHKSVLEEMRTYHSLMHAEERENRSPLHLSTSISSNGEDSPDNAAGKLTENISKFRDFYDNFDMKFLFSSSAGRSRALQEKASSVVPQHFQHVFMKLLRNAQFEELSAQDLLLTDALNTDYLLTLPIYVDWKKASESNAIIFRRGYTTEREKGFLIIEKLDYLQSRLLQKILFGVSRPLRRLGILINEALQKSTQMDDFKALIKNFKKWLEDQAYPNALNAQTQVPFTDLPEYSQPEAGELPIWLASQRAALRYQGFFSSTGPRERLVRKFFAWIGFIPSIPEASVDYDAESQTSETNMRPIFLPRITLSDIWKRASFESCGGNVWKMLKTGISVIFSRSVLQEPAFQELILLYTENLAQDYSETGEDWQLQLKVYERIPYPQLPVVFPHKKLSFRILDTIRLDIASILGLLAYFVNYKFENIVSSPSAFLLDVVAISALILFITRVGLGYKQTWDRYQLLVNKTLYEKTLASGFGSVHFLLDASEQQQYKEAILAYGILLSTDKFQMSTRQCLAEACAMFLYNKFHTKCRLKCRLRMLLIH
ncbi:DUF3754 family protein, putative (DUF3754) isoform X2 [Wolffia australiana]